ncbi:hypothetical protein BDV06DRAFT_184471 [Aspergillus oleicola]
MVRRHIKDPEDIVALKIDNPDCLSHVEREMEMRIASARPFHLGQLLCRTYDPMRESLLYVT